MLPASSPFSSCLKTSGFWHDKNINVFHHFTSISYSIYHNGRDLKTLCPSLHGNSRGIALKFISLNVNNHLEHESFLRMLYLHLLIRHCLDGCLDVVTLYHIVSGDLRLELESPVNLLYLLFLSTTFLISLLNFCALSSDVSAFDLTSTAPIS